MDITIIIAKLKEEMKKLFATKEDVPTKTSDLINDNDFITNSDISEKEIRKLGKNEKWLEKKLKENGFKDKNEVFYMGVNDLDEIYIIGNIKDKEKNK